MGKYGLFVAMAAIMGAGAASATEATEFANEPSISTRADVTSEGVRARTAGESIGMQEADQRVDRLPSMRGGPRARAVPQAHGVDPLYIGG